MKKRTAAGSSPGEFPHSLVEDASVLASYSGWSEEEYRDLLAVQTGEMSEARFKEKYVWEKAILVLDLVGFTESTIAHGELASMLRIVEAHKVCLPVLNDFGANFVRSFADDLVALFDEPYQALVAAFEIHDRVRLFSEYQGLGDRGMSCCIGIGYGKVMRTGPNLAQGDEMNKASKLGEDIANSEQTLVTHSVYDALRERKDLKFEDMHEADALFPFYEAMRRR